MVGIQPKRSGGHPPPTKTGHFAVARKRRLSCIRAVSLGTTPLPLIGLSGAELGCLINYPLSFDRLQPDLRNRSNHLTGAGSRTLIARTLLKYRSCYALENLRSIFCSFDVPKYIRHRFGIYFRELVYNVFAILN